MSSPAFDDAVSDLGLLNKHVVLFTVVVICISLKTYDAEHVFICLFAICVSSLVRCLLSSLTQFLNQVVYFLIVEF